MALWLTPLGAASGGEKKQRIGRYFLPIAALVCVAVLFLPWSHRDVLTDAREYIVVALTPIFIAGAYLGAIAVEKAVRQRVRKSARQGNRHG